MCKLLRVAMGVEKVHGQVKTSNPREEGARIPWTKTAGHHRSAEQAGRAEGARRVHSQPNLSPAADHEVAHGRPPEERGTSLRRAEGVEADHPAGAVGTGNPLPAKESKDPVEAESETRPLQRPERRRTAAPAEAAE